MAFYDSDDSDYDDLALGGLPKIKPRTIGEFMQPDDFDTEPFDWNIEEESKPRPVLLKDAFKESTASDVDDETYNLLLEDLRMAVINGNLDLVAKYVPGFIDVDFKFRNDWTVLTFAALGAQEKVIEYLVSLAGCNVNQWKGSFHPMIAVVCAEVTASDPTPLDEMENRIIRCLEVLIKAGASVNCQDSFGMRPLAFAIKNNQLQVSSFLLSKGAEVDAQDQNGDTALHIAASRGNGPAVSLLIQSGANVQLRNRFDKTPVHFAQIYHHVKLAHWMYTFQRQIEPREDVLKSIEEIFFENSPFLKFLPEPEETKESDEGQQVTESSNESPSPGKMKGNSATSVLCVVTAAAAITILALWCKRRI